MKTISALASALLFAVVKADWSVVFFEEATCGAPKEGMLKMTDDACTAFTCELPRDSDYASRACVTGLQESLAHMDKAFDNQPLAVGELFSGTDCQYPDGRVFFWMADGKTLSRGAFSHTFSRVDNDYQLTFTKGSLVLSTSILRGEEIVSGACVNVVTTPIDSWSFKWYVHNAPKEMIEATPAPATTAPDASSAPITTTEPDASNSTAASEASSAPDASPAPIATAESADPSNPESPSNPQTETKPQTESNPSNAPPNSATSEKEKKDTPSNDASRISSVACAGLALAAGVMSALL